MKNNLYREFALACQKEDKNPTTWAEENGLSTGTPTALKNGTRPSIETLRKLSTKWSSPSRGVNVIIAYLRDELERIGLSPEQVKISLSDAEATPDLNNELRLLDEFMQRVPNLRSAIHEIVTLLPYSEWAKQSPQDVIAQAEADSAAMRKMGGSSSFPKSKSAE